MDKSSFVYAPFRHTTQHRVGPAIPIETKSEPLEKEQRKDWEENNVVMRNKVWMVFTLRQGVKS